MLVDRLFATASVFFTFATVEPPCILAENRGLVLLLEVLTVQNFVDLLHTVVDRDLVREIGREHERLKPHPLNRVSQGLLVTLAANEDSVVRKIIGGMPIELESTVFQFALEPIEHERNPRRAAFH